MQTIKLLRLHNDEMVIATLEPIDGGYILKEPFIVYIFSDEKTGKQSVSLDYWLPVPILETNDAIIKNDDILTKMTPSSVFTEYYQNAVLQSEEKRKKEKENILEDVEESLTQEEMKLLLETIDPPSSKYIN
jgi:hypothetical protein